MRKAAQALLSSMTVANCNESSVKAQLISLHSTRLLNKLYNTPELRDIYRMVHFGYSNSSLLLLHGCQGETIISTNGLRQGDPLSSLLFSLYMKDVYSSISAAAPSNDIYAFIDDLNIVGTPDNVVNAFDALLTELQKVGLRCNFRITTSLANQNCQYTESTTQS